MQGDVWRWCCSEMGTAAVLAWRGSDHREQSWWLYEYGISMVPEKGMRRVLVCGDKSTKAASCTCII